MTTIAHLSDVHLNGSRERRARFARALGQVARSGADHLVVSGDLTGAGRPAEFAEVGAVLGDWPPWRLTLVPGNHDGAPGGWARALAGPLARYASTSQPGSVHTVGRDAIVVAVSTQAAKRAPIFWATGHVDGAQLRLLDTLTRPHVSGGRVVVIAMHHGPQAHLLQPLEGLSNRRQLDPILARPGVAVLCGHDHRILDLGPVHVAASVAEHADPLRLYAVAAGALVPTYQSRERGNHLGWLGL